MGWSDYFARKKLNRGQEYDEWKRADESRGAIADGSYFATGCPARYITPKFPYKAIDGKIVATMDYTTQDGRFVGTDTQGRKHIVQENCDGSIVTGELYLQEVIRHVGVASETDVVLKAATLNEYWFGGAFFNSNNTTAQRMRTYIHLKDSGVNFNLCAHDWFQTNAEAEYAQVYAPVPMRIINSALYFSSLGSAVSVGCVAYIFNRLKPSSITFTDI